MKDREAWLKEQRQRRQPVITEEEIIGLEDAVQIPLVPRADMAHVPEGQAGAAASSSSTAPRVRITEKTAPENVPMRDAHVEEEMTGEEEPREKRARLALAMLHEAEEELKQTEEFDMTFWETVMEGWPADQVLAGDIKECEGLLRRGTFVPEDTEEEPSQNARVIDTKVVRVPKAEVVKSRLCVRDFRTNSPTADLFAATPALSSVRIQLTVESVRRSQSSRTRVAKIGDSSQAFTLADIDEEVWIWLPQQWQGLRVRMPDGKFIVLDTAKPKRCRRALYGLRRSPRLWQDYAAGCLAKAGLRRLKADPSVFVDDQGTIIVLHVDDLLMTGEENRVQQVWDILQPMMALKEVAVLRNAGDR